MPDQCPPLPLHQRSLPTTPHATTCHPSSQRHCRPRLGQQGLGRSGTGGWESAATGLQVLVATGAMGWGPQARTGDRERVRRDRRVLQLLHQSLLREQGVSLVSLMGQR